MNDILSFAEFGERDAYMELFHSSLQQEEVDALFREFTNEDWEGIQTPSDLGNENTPATHRPDSSSSSMVVEVSSKYPTPTSLSREKPQAPPSSNPPGAELVPMPVAAPVSSNVMPREEREGASSPPTPPTPYLRTPPDAPAPLSFLAPLATAANTQLPNHGFPERAPADDMNRVGPMYSTSPSQQPVMHPLASGYAIPFTYNGNEPAQPVLAQAMQSFDYGYNPNNPTAPLLYPYPSQPYPIQTTENSTLSWGPAVAPPVSQPYQAQMMSAPLYLWIPMATAQGVQQYPVQTRSALSHQWAPTAAAPPAQQHVQQMMPPSPSPVGSAASAPHNRPAFAPQPVAPRLVTPPSRSASNLRQPMSTQVPLQSQITPPRPALSRTPESNKRVFDFTNVEIPDKFVANPNNHGRWEYDSEGNRTYLNAPKVKRARKNSK